MPRAVESARILFARSCINRTLLHQFNSAFQLQLTPRDLTVHVLEDLHSPLAPVLSYRFDRQLRLVRLETSDAFLQRHSQMHRERLLDHPWSEAERLSFEKVERVPGPTR